MWETVWTIANSGVGITVMVALIAFVLNRSAKAKSFFEEYEGTLTAAVKRAEKAVPDNADNKSLSRLNSALGYVLKVLEARQGKPPTKKQIAEAEEALSVKHSELEAAGTLKK